MAASLSDGEFNRMQTQLLALRETNYELEDKCKKQERELISLRDQFSILEKDNQKANQAINRSKKAKEFDLLIHENESMQMKLQSQEDDFRLQNEALMNELAKLVTSNELLEKELNDLKSSVQSKSVDESANANLTDDIRRLQAQNTALQNSLSSCQKEHEDQCALLKHTMAELREQSHKQTSTGGNITSISEANSVDGNSEIVCNEQSNGNSNTAEDIIDSSIGTIPAKDSMKQINEFRLHLDTEKEENRLLKEQLQMIEAKHKEETKYLQNEIDRLNEKLRKKQESLLQLQEDKDRLFCELSEKVQDVQTNKDNEITALQQLSTKLQKDLSSAKHEFEDELQHSKTCILELEELIAGLQKKMDSASQENNDKLAERLSHYENQIKELKNQVLDRNNKIDDLKTQLQECQKAQSSTMDQMLAVQLDRDNQILALQEASGVAEKRKSLLDQLAVKYQEETDRHRDQIKSLTAAHDSKVSELNGEIERLKALHSSLSLQKQAALSELTDVKSQMEQLKPQITSLEGAKSWLERRLAETEENLQQTRDKYETQIDSIRQEHATAIEELSENSANQLQGLQTEIAELRKGKEDLEETIKKLDQEIKDQMDGKILHEKKGSTMLKDLKRQLQAERKRADKLQEKLQEFLSDSRSRQSVEELFRPVDSYERQKFGDSSSVSSWSPSGLGRENSIIAQSPDEEVSYASLRQENDDLLKRLADVQEQKWILEEKVSHLESSNGAMVDDLLRKTAVIEHYSMDSKAGQVVTSPSNEKMTPLKRVVDFVIDKGDDGTKDINRKLQRVLEETLTKNMHLQQDLEMMSKELEELRKRPSNVTL